MNLSLLKEARAILENSTPMNRDCGLYCQKACCQPDEDGQGGVYLFPGEEELIGDWGDQTAVMLGEWETLLLTCEGECERDRRPLGCMIFPLAPVFQEDGSVRARLDCRSRAMCPLNRNGIEGLRAQFVADVEKAFNLLLQDEDYASFLRAWQELEDCFRRPFL